MKISISLSFEMEGRILQNL